MTKNDVISRLTVSADNKPVYDILLAEDFSALSQEMEKLSIQNRRLCIVTDTNVASLYLEEIQTLLTPICKEVISYVFSAGEANKNLDTVQKLYETLIISRFDRNDLLVALGGGVVGDLCGFAAATYLRGISFVQVPTTLLSQVDSSIGGKTGVDFNAYKNMVGAFHMPKLVYINISTLKTLPEKEFSAGMGEVLKHGLIKDKAYYEWLLSNAERLKEKEITALKEAVAGSNRIKRTVVQNDPREKGERMHLNFGHTLGHAIEKLKDFSLLHGECVALGSVAAMKISAGRGLIPMEEVERLKEALKTFGLAVSVEDLTCDEIIRASKNDKKMDSGTIRFILLEAIGCACVDSTVTEDEMKYGLDCILKF